MREVLFRGKKKDADEWVVGSLVAMDGPINAGRRYILPLGDGLAFEHYGERGTCSIGSFVEVEPATVGQALWITAKDGSRIFEGDILRVFDELVLIVWQRHRFIAQKKNGQPMTWVYISGGGEIIGNKYDDPDLFRGNDRRTSI